jgi:hypothetical protein
MELPEDYFTFRKRQEVLEDRLLDLWFETNILGTYF